VHALKTALGTQANRFESKKQRARGAVWIERLPSKQNAAGSSPAGRAISVCRNNLQSLSRFFSSPCPPRSVFGDLKEGDRIAIRGADQLWPGTGVSAASPL
jgi:hypothetical protein